MTYKSVGFFCIALALAGCAEQPEPTGVIPQHQLDALEKAKKVEGVLKQNVENLDKTLDE